MKKILLFLSFIIVIAGCSQAQTTDPNHIKQLVPYRILDTDSSWVTPAQLKKNKPVMMIYFSPDCGHCQRLMYELKPKMKELNDIQVVMITFAPYRAVKEFYKNFGLSAYHNFTVGTEGYTYFVQRYYAIRTTPYVIIYDHKGKLVKFFDTQPKVEDIIAAIKKA